MYFKPDPSTPGGHTLDADSFEDMLFSEDFSILLGLKNTPDGHGIPKGQEMLRLQVMMVFRQRNLKESEAQREVIWSKFCASYLPATVERFLDPWLPSEPESEDQKDDFQLQNVCLDMLVMLQNNVYFAKYLRSTKPVAEGNMKFGRAVAERLLVLAPRWDKAIVSAGVEQKRPRELYAGVSATAIQLLSSILTTYVSNSDQDAIVPGVTRVGLRPFLVSWEKHHRGTVLGDVCFRTAAQLLGLPQQNAAIYAEVKAVKRTLKGWDSCGYPLCAKLDPKDMKACAKCQTVRYCSADHQQLHWKSGYGAAAHKQLCHRTEY